MKRIPTGRLEVIVWWRIQEKWNNILHKTYGGPEEEVSFFLERFWTDHRQPWRPETWDEGNWGQASAAWRETRDPYLSRVRALWRRRPRR